MKQSSHGSSGRSGWWAWLLSLALTPLAACGAGGAAGVEPAQAPSAIGAAAPAEPQPEPVLDVPGVALDPVVGGSAAAGPVCARSAPRLGQGGVIVFDYEDRVIEPLPYGPRIADAPRHSPAYSSAELGSALRERRGWLRGCYRWARHREPALEGSLLVRAAWSPLGQLEQLDVSSDDPAARELVACATDVLGGLAFRRTRFGSTDAEFTIAFTHHAAATRPPRRPARPDPSPAPSPDPSAACWASAAGPRARLVSTAPLLAVDDFDTYAEHLRSVREARALRRRDPGARVSVIPYVRPSTSTISRSLDGRRVGRAIDANVGRYRECYREALVDDPELAGRLVLRAHVTPSGDIPGVLVGSTDLTHEGLLECMRNAVREVWLHDGGAEDVAQITLRFVFQPGEEPLELPTRGTPTELERDARLLLERGDAEGALRRLRALLEQLPDDARRCRWQAQALEAGLLARPWVDQAVDALVHALLVALERAEGPEAGACFEQAAPLLLRATNAPLAAIDEDAQPLLADDTGDVRSLAVPELIIERFGPLVALAPRLPGLARVPALVTAAEVQLGLRAAPSETSEEASPAAPEPALAPAASP